MTKGRDSKSAKRRYVRFTRWRRQRFFALLAESGNVRLAAELSGAGLGCIYRLRRTEPGFTEKMAAARAEASARLTRPPTERPHPNPSSEGEGLVIRRGIGGRLRKMAVGPHWWTERHDAVFLGHLRITGNISGSARAAGFTPKSAWNRRERLPGFARAWDEALAESEGHLEGELTATVLRGGADPEAIARAMAGARDQWFDVELAIRLLGRWEKRRARRDRAGGTPKGI